MLNIFQRKSYQLTFRGILENVPKTCIAPTLSHSSPFFLSSSSFSVFSPCYNHTDTKDSSTAKDSSISYYNLFPKTFPNGPPPTGPFIFNLKQLRKEFLTLQSKTHPDYASNEEDRQKYEHQSSLLNKAYETLSKPLLRAQHLLKLNKNIDLLNDDEAKKYSTNDIDNNNVLLTIMEIHELIDEAETEDDVKSIKSENNERIKKCEEKLNELFKDEDYDEAARIAIQLRYWVNIRNGLKNWEPGQSFDITH